MTIDQLKKVNRDLDGKIHQLDTLFESAKEFSGILDEERLIKLFSLTLMGHIGTNRYALCLKNGKNITSKISSEHLDEYKNILFELISEPVLLTEELLNSVFLKVRPCLTAEKIRAVIPLQIQNEVQGVLCVGERLREGDYSQEELEFLYSLASFAILSLENARLFKEAIEKQRLENELLIAREIQQNLLPRHIPEIKNFEIAAVNVSSKQVGGDYYDIIPLHNSQFVLAIGDVAGKGTPASLLMANAQATLRTLVPFQLSLPETTARINDIIFENTTPDKFITFFLGLLNSETKEFSYVNAGHNPPFVLRANGSIERLTEGGIILGIMKAMIPYKEGKIILEQGDSVILFTDGVSEAMNSNGEEYTEEKLEEIIRGFRHYSAGKILSSITHEITSYTIGAPQSDDITLMVFTAL
ncbi:MAG: PP2C family protein-serine/threonine phosphatase [Bacteroidetes bacterium]|nr:PP2C family protein-serine/threonine phosphatase [Bacteroidota bacterium]